MVLEMELGELEWELKELEEIGSPLRRPWPKTRPNNSAKAALQVGG